MKIKEELKKCDFLRHIVKKIKIKKEFMQDAKLFCQYYMEAKQGIQQIEYNILHIVHSLEKGMGSKHLRPFGKQKVIELVKVLNCYPEGECALSSTAYKMGISILEQWKNIYDVNAWKQDEAYFLVEKYLSEKMNSQFIVDVGISRFTSNDKYKDFQYLDAISERHSIREFAHCCLKMEDVQYCVNAAILSPSACNRQMCKIYWVKDEEKKKGLSDMIMGLGGFEKEGANYFVVTYDIGAFSFYGERNQGYFNAGLFAMNFVNALHFKGIGSCFLQWGNTVKEENKAKRFLNISDNERIAVVIAAGYYPEECTVLKSCRKRSEEVYRVL